MHDMQTSIEACACTATEKPNAQTTGCVETECGGANFLSCGGQTCNANICTDSIATYLV